MKFSKSIALGLATFLTASVVLIFPGGANATLFSGTALSPVGEQAFNDLKTCLTSGKNPSLDVYYLIDNSGSLSYTDSQNVRQKVLETSVRQLKSFTDQGVSVSYAASTFASGVQTIAGWTSLNSDGAFETAAQRIHSTVNNSNLHGYTDWLGGMQSARNAFSSRGTDSCKMVIWFTDGGVNPTGNPSDTTAALKGLCNSGISSNSLGSKSDKLGLMNSLRKQGITVFGVLYQNDASTLKQFESDFANQKSKYTGQERLDLEHYLMSYMIPLVEGSGSIPASAAAKDEKLPPAGNLVCANVDSNGLAPAGTPNGAFINAKDPVGLAYQFMRLQNTMNGGSGSAIKNGAFEIPAGTAAFSIITTGKNWKLSSPSAAKLNLSPATLSKAGKYSINSSAGATQIDVQVADAAAMQGTWQFTGGGVNSELFIYSGLTLVLDRDKQSQVVAGRDNTLTGAVVRTVDYANVPVDLSEYPNHTLTLQTKDATGKLENVAGVNLPVSNAGTFKVEHYKPQANLSEQQLWLTLDLGNSFDPVKSQFLVKIVDPASIAVPSSDVVQMTSLDGPKGTSKGSITVTGATQGSLESKFCLDQSLIRVSDAQTDTQKVDRLAGFSWRFNGIKPVDPYCVSVPSGQSKTIQVQAQNPTQANSHVVSIRAYQSQAGAANLDGTIQFEFDSHAQVNELAKWLGIILLLLLGFAIPLFGLYFFNKATTKFLPTNGVVQAQYPVVFSPNGDIRLLDGRSNSASSIQVTPEDFKPVVANTKPAATLPLGAAGLGAAKVKLWPLLNSPWFEMQAAPGTRLLSVYRGAHKNASLFANGYAQETSPNLADVWALSIPEAELIKARNLMNNPGNHSSQENSAPQAPGATPVVSAGKSEDLVRGTLVVYSRMGMLADYQSKVANISMAPSLTPKFKQLMQHLDDPRPGVKATKPRNGGSTPPPAGSGPTPPNPMSPPAGGLPTPPAPGSSPVPIPPQTAGVPTAPSGAPLPPPPAGGSNILPPPPPGA